MARKKSCSTRPNIVPLVEKYKQSFAQQGVTIDYRFHESRQNLPDTRRHSEERFDYIMYRIGYWFRKLFTKNPPKRKTFDEYNKDYAKNHAQCLVLQFKLADTPSLPAKEYSLPYKTEDRYGDHTISPDRVIRKAEKLLVRKLRYLEKHSASSLCTNTRWDKLRYTTGYYGYKKDVEGLRFGFWLLLALLGLIAYLICLFI